MSARAAAIQDIKEELGDVDFKYLYYNESYDIRLCHIFCSKKEQLNFNV